MKKTERPPKIEDRTSVGALGVERERAMAQNNEMASKTSSAFRRGCPLCSHDGYILEDVTPLEKQRKFKGFMIDKSLCEDCPRSPSVSSGSDDSDTSSGASSPSSDSSDDRDSTVFIFYEEEKGDDPDGSDDLAKEEGEEKVEAAAECPNAEPIQKGVKRKLGAMEEKTTGEENFLQKIAEEGPVAQEEMVEAKGRGRAITHPYGNLCFCGKPRKGSKIVYCGPHWDTVRRLRSLKYKVLTTAERPKVTRELEEAVAKKLGGDADVEEIYKEFRRRVPEEEGEEGADGEEEEGKEEPLEKKEVQDEDKICNKTGVPEEDGFSPEALPPADPFELDIRAPIWRCAETEETFWNTERFGPCPAPRLDSLSKTQMDKLEKVEDAIEERLNFCWRKELAQLNKDLDHLFQTREMVLTGRDPCENAD